MTRIQLLFLCALLGLTACAARPGDDHTAAPAGARSPLEPAQIAQQSIPAIVRVEARSSRGQGVGTGFVLTADGRIATNLHVIGGATEIDVVLRDGTRLPVEDIAAADPDRDLAVLSVKPGGALPTLALGDSDGVVPGEPVIAISNPLGVLDFSVSDGLVSSVRQVSPELTILQISAPISQGSSGGPLFNRFGEVIGVATFIAGAGQNLNFGIPSNYLRPMVGRDEGISPAALSEALARQYGSAPQGSGGRIERRVPRHDVAILDGCSEDSLTRATDEISRAIGTGAPLYNQGNHEACYRIYEGAAMRLERELECPGLRDALGQGLLRASTLDDFTAKAWAMRDAFDGVLDVVGRRSGAAAGAPAAPEPGAGEAAGD